MSWEFILTLILILLVFFAFISMFFFQKKRIKKNQEVYESKSFQRKRKAENNEDILLKEYISLIKEVLELLEQFDPIKGKYKMTEINDFANKRFKEISSFNNLKGMKITKDSRINWELIEKLTKTKASNWKKNEKDIKELITIDKNDK